MPTFRAKIRLTRPDFEGQAKKTHQAFTEHWPGVRKIGIFSLSRSWHPKSLQRSGYAKRPAAGAARAGEGEVEAYILSPNPVNSELFPLEDHDSNDSHR